MHLKILSGTFINNVLPITSEIEQSNLLKKIVIWTTSVLPYSHIDQYKSTNGVEMHLAKPIFRPKSNQI